jgi:hypothetical protein
MEPMDFRPRSPVVGFFRKKSVGVGEPANRAGERRAAQSTAARAWGFIGGKGTCF